MSRTMTTDRFEIRVALIGYVSVGKSTVLNALLGDKYSEVSMNRTTAGINMFRVVNKIVEEGPNKRARRSKEDTPSTVPSTDTASVVSDDSPTRSAKSTHAEIRQDNKSLRSNSTVQEKTFVIEVDEPICEMRKDTDLVIVDVPGINEADSSSKYKEYVAKNWNAFDLIVLVMDAIQGVNTEEQVQLLKFVKENNKKKGIHTIIVGNKLDDPDDDEKIQLVDEAREKVIEIFGNGCSKKSLESVLKSARDGKVPAAKKSLSFFIPMSALHAFIYRKATRLTMEQFREFDKGVIDKIGHEEVGRKWKRLTEKEKFDTIHAAVSDPTEFKERLASTNFDNFLTLLSYLVAGEKVQQTLIERQLDFELNNLSHSTCIADQIHSIYNKSNGIGRDTGDLNQHFWRTYNEMKDASIASFDTNLDPSFLCKPFNELVQYHKLSCVLSWDDEKKLVEREIDSLLRHQLQTVIEKQKTWNFRTWYREFANGIETPINFSPHDWTTLISSILLPSQERAFIENFGQEKIELERLLFVFRYHFDPLLRDVNMTLEYPPAVRVANKTSTRQSTSTITRKEAMYDTLSKKDCAKYNAIVRLEMPRSLSDPKHWGHLAWEYSKFHRKLEQAGL